MKNVGLWLNNWNFQSTIWIWFILFASLTLFASLQMVKYAKLIIQKTKLGGAFVGLVFVSFITSIPELFTEISQGLLEKPVVAITDDIGSNAFSMFILSIVILIFIKKLNLSKISKLTIISIFISLALSSLMIFVLKYQLDFKIINNSFLTIGITPFIFLFSYIGFVIFSYKNRHLADPEPEKKIKTNLTNKMIFVLFTLTSLFLVFFVICLNISVNAMQISYNIPSKSAGGLLLSITTSLPEIIALISFAKGGYLSAAISSIVGSHILNLSGIFWGDLAFTKDSAILSQGVQETWWIGLIAAVEIALFIIFIFISKKVKNKIILSIIPVIIILIYIIGWVLILQ